MNNKQLGQYYTKSKVAKQCVYTAEKVCDFNNYDTILEPSAGTGSFYQFLPKEKRLGIDIEPKCAEIIKANFLHYTLFSKKVLTIGNPPFGVQSKIAIQFFNHAAKFSDTIAFIVPVTWKKWSIHRRLDQRYKLTHIYSLKSNSFLFNNVDFNVKCIFQIWTRKDTAAKDLRIYQAPVTKHSDFNFLPKSQKDNADFLLIVCGARKQLIKEVNAPIAVQTTERIKANVAGVREIFESIDWGKYSDTNTGTMWINRATIVEEYKKAKSLISKKI